MAEIYLARQSGAHGFDKVVALKLLRPELMGEGGFKSMFFAEARTGALLSHPHIVQTFDVGDLNGHIYMAMEFVNGEPLSSVSPKVAKERRFPVPLAVCIIRDIAAALDYAHTLHDHDGEPLQLVHRDISPSNIMLTHDGNIKLLDFGIAKVSTEMGLTQAGAIKGKFSYLSPEQARGEKLDGRSDVFSLGIVAWQLLTGERAIQGDNEMAMLNAIVNQDLRTLSETGIEVDPELEELVMKAVRRDREDRYASAREMSDAFAAYLAKSFPGYSVAAEVRTIMKEHFGERAAQVKQVIASAGNRAAADSSGGIFDPQDGVSMPSISANRSSPSLGPTTGPNTAIRAQNTGRVVAAGGTDRYAVRGPATMGGYAYASDFQQKSHSKIPLIIGLALLLVAGGVAAWFLTRPAAERVVSITSDPGGAEVAVDGVSVGKTPVEVVLTAGKTSSVVLTKHGFEGFQQVVRADEEPGSIHAVLVSAGEMGTLVVTSTPAGATVVIDGKQLEQVTPIVLADLSVSEPHSVVVKSDGYAPVVRDVRFDDGGSQEIQVTLQPTKHAFVAARCEPDACDVIINGTAVGKTPVDSHSVAAGVPVSVQLMQGDKYVLNETRSLTAGQLEVFEHKKKPETKLGSELEPEPDSAASPADPQRAQPTKARYTWRVETDPPRAAVYQGDKRVCAASPCRISHTTPDSRPIHVKADGYKDATATLMQGGGRVVVTLEKQQRSSMERLQ